jgi:hypothetical protein
MALGDGALHHVLGTPCSGPVISPLALLAREEEHFEAPGQDGQCHYSLERQTEHGTALVAEQSTYRSTQAG